MSEMIEDQVTVCIVHIVIVVLLISECIGCACRYLGSSSDAFGAIDFVTA